MRIDLDPKQAALVRSWIEQSDRATDRYTAFISLWIAFNALCCAKYARDANKRRADLGTQTGLKPEDDPIAVSGEMSMLQGGRIRLDLKTRPGRIVVTISERYTEEIVFEAFAKDYRHSYGTWSATPDLRGTLLDLQRAITKPDGKPYVINMAKIGDYGHETDHATRKARRIIVPFENIDDLRELKDVLYQVRCNIFHGEKAPGEPNDDRIVGAALPVLRHLVTHAAPEYAGGALEA